MSDCCEGGSAIVLGPNPRAWHINAHLALHSICCSTTSEPGRALIPPQNKQSTETNQMIFNLHFVVRSKPVVQPDWHAKSALSASETMPTGFSLARAVASAAVYRMLSWRFTWVGRLTDGGIPGRSMWVGRLAEEAFGARLAGDPRGWGGLRGEAYRGVPFGIAAGEW